MAVNKIQIEHLHSKIVLDYVENGNSIYSTYICCFVFEIAYHLNLEKLQKRLQPGMAQKKRNWNYQS